MCCVRFELGCYFIFYLLHCLCLACEVTLLATPELTKSFIFLIIIIINMIAITVIVVVIVVVVVNVVVTVILSATVPYCSMNCLTSF